MTSNKKLFLMSIIAVIAIPMNAEEPGTPLKYNVRSLQWNIEFSMSSLEEIAQRPEEILKDIEVFWERDKTLKVVALWYKLRQFQIDFDRMKQNLEQLIGNSLEQRLKMPAYQLAKKLSQEKKDFCSKAIPHVCSFLPDNGLEFNANVYFTNAIDPSGFAVTTGKTHVVINTSNPHWKDSLSTIQCALVHELFHAGYNKNFFLFRNEIELENKSLYDLITRLQNEGLATYVAYRATPMFTAPAETDFLLLDKKAEVLSRLKKLNKLFRAAANYTDDKLRWESWRIGVEDRGYYVVGAYMARRIDEERGREILIETIKQGPRSFVETYNSLAEKGMTIFEFKAPSGPSSIFQKLRESVIRQDYASYLLLFNELKNAERIPSGDVEYNLNRIGGLLMFFDKIDLAMDIFRLNLKYHTKSLGAHSGLGDAYLKKGEIDRAIMVYKYILEIDPFNIDLEEKIQKLRLQSNKNYKRSKVK